MPKTETSAITVALIGNPNTGKSTLFNALCGLRQHVGNYPGVTVEKKEGRLEVDGQSFSVIDLPGTYSLAPRSPDEMVTVDVLLGRRDDTPLPDVVICIVDASNLERNLYIVSQVLELGRPTVVALNMVDLAESKGVRLDLARLRTRLPGVPLIEIQAHRKLGLQQLKQALAKTAALEADTFSPPESPFPAAFQAEVQAIETASGLKKDQHGNGRLPRYLAERLLLDTSGYLEQCGLPGVDPPLVEQVKAARQRLAAQGLQVPGVEPMSRYRWVGKVLEGVVTRDAQRRVTPSDRLDRVLTHKLWGTAAFVLLMVVMFQLLFWIAEPASYVIDQLNSLLARRVEALLDDGPLRSLLIVGIINGVGGVLVFVPQIMVLFFFIAVLEDCGYMARAAYLMDRLMSRVGLSGKSFIPLLSSFACAIPGIMAARVIENSRDRLVTILVAPLMSCSARLPVYTLLIAAFIPDSRWLGGLVGLKGLTMFAMYAIGILAAVIVAFLVKQTILRGPTPPFVMELPSYKLPGLGNVLHRVFDRSWAFVRRAGTLILAVSIVVWAATYYPRDPRLLPPKLLAEQARLQAELGQGTHGDLADQLRKIEHEIAGEYLSQSYLGRVGRFLEPAVRPLGWDWRIGCAVIASFPAREVVVATLGVIYRLGSEETEDSATLHDTLRSATWDGTDRPVFNIPVALSVMVFFALCAQCASTLAIMRRETNSWRWPIFTFVYMTTLAYFAAFATYQIGMLF